MFKTIDKTRRTARMNVILAIFFLSFALSTCKVEQGTGNGNKDQAADDYMHQQEKQIIAAMNEVRADPTGWCERNGLPMLDGSPAGEALHMIHTAGALEPKGLFLSAKYWTKAMTASGQMSHDAMNSRFSKYGAWNGKIGENVGPSSIGVQASGPPDSVNNYGARVVNEFIRDRDVQGKGHRQNIMDPDFKYVGVSLYGDFVALEFAAGYTDKPDLTGHEED
jgi:uncharacterized protein YkwD